jgi:hypothetical protein
VLRSPRVRRSSVRFEWLQEGSASFIEGTTIIGAFRMAPSTRNARRDVVEDAISYSLERVEKNAVEHPQFTLSQRRKTKHHRRSGKGRVLRQQKSR